MVFLSLPPAGPDGTFGLGLGADYLATLVGTARVVIAEVNDQVPDVSCDRRLSPARSTSWSGFPAAGRVSGRGPPATSR